MLLLIGKAAQRRSKRQWKNTGKEKRRKKHQKYHLFSQGILSPTHSSDTVNKQKEVQYSSISKQPPQFSLAINLQFTSIYICYKKGINES